jgi:hypothetical protein
MVHFLLEGIIAFATSADANSKPFVKVKLERVLTGSRHETFTTRRRPQLTTLAAKWESVN